MQTIIKKSTYNVWDLLLGDPVLMAETLNYIQPEKIIVIGVALDICVSAFAKGLVGWVDTGDCKFDEMPELYLITDATKGLSKPDDTLIELSGLGFNLCDSDYVRELI
jgi:nicotinamidase-related amidase